MAYTISQGAAVFWQGGWGGQLHYACGLVLSHRAQGRHALQLLRLCSVCAVQVCPRASTRPATELSFGVPVRFDTGATAPTKKQEWRIERVRTGFFWGGGRGAVVVVQGCGTYRKVILFDSARSR